MREAKLSRKTKETEIELSLNIDGSGKYSIVTGCGFLDHMLELFTAHGCFDLNLTCKGDIKVDYHHTVEDVAIVLGNAFDKALEDRAGIRRYGSMIIPMDEALILAAVDISGRAALGYGLETPSDRVGDFDTELVKEFMTAFCRSMGSSIHFKQFSGDNSHHIIEGAFKALARAMAKAVSKDNRFYGKIPSTKGCLN